MSTCDETEKVGGRVPSREWLLRMADKEDALANMSTSVGGLAISLGEPAVRETEVVDGYLIDSRTGEVLEYVGRPEFHVTDDSAAEWVLERRGEIEADLAAIRARREAILANLDRLEREQAARLKAWDWRFAGELEQFARGRLEGGRKRTWQCPFGSVAIRKTPARWTWADAPDAKERAVEWARENWTPELIKAQGIVRTKVEEVPVLDKIVGMVETLEKAGSMEDVREATFAFLSYVPEGEAVTIKTGVGK